MVERDGISSSAANAEYFGRALPGPPRRMGTRPFASALLRT
jgi:hypothetical protein